MYLAMPLLRLLRLLPLYRGFPSKWKSLSSCLPFLLPPPLPRYQIEFPLKWRNQCFFILPRPRLLLLLLPLLRPPLLLFHRIQQKGFLSKWKSLSSSLPFLLPPPLRFQIEFLSKWRSQCFFILPRPRFLPLPLLPLLLPPLLSFRLTQLKGFLSKWKSLSSSLPFLLPPPPPLRFQIEFLSKWRNQCFFILPLLLPPLPHSLLLFHQIQQKEFRFEWKKRLSIHPLLLNRVLPFLFQAWSLALVLLLRLIRSLCLRLLFHLEFLLKWRNLNFRLRL